MGFDFGDALDTLLEAYGETVALVGDQWRVDSLTAVIQGPWVGASTMGIPVDRTEPMATFRTEDLAEIPVEVGHRIELGTRIFRILGMMADDYGATEMALAEE